MTPFNRLSGVLATLAIMAGIVWASHAPMTAHASDDAVLRLAWSALPERIETCRQQSEEELEHVPQHMRQPVVCEGAAAHYRLSVRLGGQLVDSQIVQAGGMRHDRRLFVFRELPAPAGEAVVDVRFERVEADQPQTGHDHAEEHAARQQTGETVPPRLALVERLSFRPRAVILVTYDEVRRELVSVSGSPPETR